MTAETLGLHHKELLHERLKKLGLQVSEYSFPNLYLFRNEHRYEVVFIDSSVFIKGVTYDGFSYLMPTEPMGNLDTDYLMTLMETVDFLFPIPEEWRESLARPEFEISCTKGDMDYVYTVEKMSTFKGRHLHNKRNLLRKFTEGYRHEELPLTKDRIGDALFVLDQWQAESEHDINQTDYASCREALTLYDELILCGGIYYADGDAAGFIIGEELHTDTFVLHFAKASKRFKGVYQYMFNSFAKVLPPQYRYLNLEQDLNRDTLRIAKSSYQPDLMLKKLRVALKR